MATSQVIQIAPPKIVAKGAKSAQVVGMMAVAVVVSVLAAELRASTTKAVPAKDSLGYALSSPFLIIAGGAGATVVFVLLTDFGGEVGETLGVGLAGLVLLSVFFIQAGPLWSILSGVFKPTTKTVAPPAKKGIPA